mmetsp:Transcript_18131/g.23707  ORF Transcript_18131/g.23707 Transcript_18131/m.23707 type:complete len:559 (+) Transcript_18131:45-1721(+)
MLLSMRVLSTRRTLTRGFSAGPKEKQLVTDIRSKLISACQSYYSLDQSDLSDTVYDSLYNDLKALEKKYPELVAPDSPTQTVGSSPVSQLSRVKHNVPMYSLENAFSSDDLRKWEKSWKRYLRRKPDSKDPIDVKYVAEPKLDGAALSLTYNKGYLIRGATRGNGKVGEDVTHIARLLDNVPSRLNSSSSFSAALSKIQIEIRGEVVLSKENFDKLNRQRELDGMEMFSNQRNVASGTLRQLDPSIARERNAEFLAFAFQSDSFHVDTYVEEVRLLEELGFVVPPSQCLDTLKEASLCATSWQSNGKAFPYQTDGTVVKIDSTSLRKVLGYRRKSPRWAIALKNSPPEVTTKVKDICISVGRSGAATPVAKLEAVKLQGTMVQRATLHNFDRVKELDIRVGDRVVIHKAGEIIPEISKVLYEFRRGKSLTRFEIPKICPECTGRLIPAGGGRYQCCNSTCPGILRGAVLQWCSRNALDIKGIGKVLIFRLVDSGLVKAIPDLYCLTKEDLLNLPGARMGELSAEKVLKSIQDSKSKEFENVIYGLGIPSIGRVRNYHI